jgi:hypothetical protein
MSQACSTHGWIINAYIIFVGKHEGKRSLGVDRTIILKRILEK